MSRNQINAYIIIIIANSGTAHDVGFSGPPCHMTQEHSITVNTARSQRFPLNNVPNTKTKEHRQFITPRVMDEFARYHHIIPIFYSNKICKSYAYP